MGAAHGQDQTSKVKGAGNCLAVCGRQRTGPSVVSSKNSSRMGDEV